MGIKLHDFGETPKEEAHGPGHVYVFHCPGCKCDHPFTVGPNGWTWNGSLEKPTFSPSLLVNQNMPASRCHSFVRDGMIQFLGDCYHGLKGQTVEMPDWEDCESGMDEPGWVTPVTPHNGDPIHDYLADKGRI